MDVPVAQVLERVLAHTRPQVAFFVGVSLQVSIDGGQHGVGADVKFTLVDQQGVGDVLLDDAGPLGILSGILDEFLKIVVVSGHLNANASVGVLSRFNYPDIGGSLV